MSELVRVLVAASCLLVVFRSEASPAVPPPSSSSAQAHYERPGTKGAPYKKRVVVFVHGIFGDSDKTWRYSPNDSPPSSPTAWELRLRKLNACCLPINFPWWE
jgi:hypothetical protein